MKSIKINTIAFTLVELIIVITILSILATIGFSSFQNYIKDSRDTNRIASLKLIENGLNTFQITTGLFPVPDNKVHIFASGNLIGYQGNIGESVSKMLKINKIPLDPELKIPFTYNINNQKNAFSLITFKENNNIALAKKTFANDSDFNHPFVLGSNLGILYSQKLPIEMIGTGIDIVTTNQSFTYITQETSISGTGGVLRVLTAGYDKMGSSSYAISCKEIKTSGLSNGSGIYSINPNLSSTGTFQVYCNMDTQGGGWHLISIVPGESVKFADRSSSGIWKNPTYDITPPNEITNKEYLSKSYQESTTNEILLCYKNTQMCYNFQHNMNVPLFNFYKDNLSYVDYSYNLYGYGNVGSSGSLKNYFSSFGLPPNTFTFQCGFLGINARITSNSNTNLVIGFGGDGGAPCTHLTNIPNNMDDVFLGLGFSLRYFNSLIYPGMPKVTAGAQYYNIIDSTLQPVNTPYGIMNAHISKNWFIMGR